MKRLFFWIALCLFSIIFSGCFIKTRYRANGEDFSKHGYESQYYYQFMSEIIVKKGISLDVWHLGKNVEDRDYNTTIFIENYTENPVFVDIENSTIQLFSYGVLLEPYRINVCHNPEIGVVHCYDPDQVSSSVTKLRHGNRRLFYRLNYLAESLSTWGMEVRFTITLYHNGEKIVVERDYPLYYLPRIIWVWEL